MTQQVREDEGRVPGPVDPALRARLAECVVAGRLLPDVAAELASRADDLAAAALPADPRHPYSRLVLGDEGGVEVMIANWTPGTRCAPHDHGGSRGLVVALRGTFDEGRHGWVAGRLVVVEELHHRAGDGFGFGPEVVHDMAAGADGGVTLHAYAPPPSSMSVYDVERELVLHLEGDFGAWIPEGAHPARSFAEVAAEAAAGSPVIWIGHTVGLERSDELEAVARTLAGDLAAAHPAAEVQVSALASKAAFVEAMAELAADGRRIAELHLVGHGGAYGITFGTSDWPEQISPHEWRSIAIPFAPGARASFHGCRTGQWFGPFFARTFGVPASGHPGPTAVSARPDAVEAPGPDDDGRRYLVGVEPASGRLASVTRRLRRPETRPMVEASPEPAPDRSYDKVAALYDAAYVDITVREAEWAWVRARAEELKARLGRPLRVVEVGCGNGSLLRELDGLGLIEEGTGFDASDGQVATAIERTGDSHPRLRFGVIDGPAIDLLDGSVDVVLSFLSFRYLDWDPLAVEIRRVLAPGGRFWVVDMVERPIRPRELPLLARSALHHVLVPRRHPQFARDVAALTAHPDWAAMLAENPIRTEQECAGFLEGRFAPGRVEVLTATLRQRVIAFDSGPVG